MGTSVEGIALKIWLVIRVLGEIAGSAGPLPYDLETCKVEATIITMDAMNKGQDQVIIRGKVIKKTDVNFECVESKTTPVAVEKFSWEK